MDARTEAADAGAAGAGLGDGRGKGLAARPPEGKHLSVDDGDGHGLGPPPRSRPREAKTGRCGRGGREGGRGGAARNYRLLWSRRSHCDARRATQRQRRIDKHKTDRPDADEDWTEGGLAWHRKSAVIRGENIPGNSLENFLGIR